MDVRFFLRSYITGTLKKEEVKIPGANEQNRKIPDLLNRRSFFICLSLLSLYTQTFFLNRLKINKHIKGMFVLCLTKFKLYFIMFNIKQTKR